MLWESHLARAKLRPGESWSQVQSKPISLTVPRHWSPGPQGVLDTPLARCSQRAATGPGFEPGFCTGCHLHLRASSPKAAAGKKLTGGQFAERELLIMLFHPICPDTETRENAVCRYGPGSRDSVRLTVSDVFQHLKAVDERDRLFKWCFRAPAKRNRGTQAGSEKGPGGRGTGTSARFPSPAGCPPLP